MYSRCWQEYSNIALLLEPQHWLLYLNRKSFITYVATKFATMFKTLVKKLHNNEASVTEQDSIREKAVQGTYLYYIVVQN